MRVGDLRAVMLWCIMACAMVMSGAAQAVVCGTALRDTEFRWLVGISQDSKPGLIGDPSCSGTLIAADIVLTARHCIDPSQPAASIRIIRHVNKDRMPIADHATVGDRDVMLLRLASAIDDAGLIFPTFPKSRAMQGAEYAVAGWGFSQHPKIIPDKLLCPSARANPWPHHAVIRVLDPALCVRLREQKYSPEPDILCAHGGAEGSPPQQSDDVSVFDRAGPGACIADSGGPLFHMSNGGAVTIIGVTLSVDNVQGNKNRPSDIWLSCARNPARYADGYAIRDDVVEALRVMRARQFANSPKNTRKT